MHKPKLANSLARFLKKPLLCAFAVTLLTEAALENIISTMDYVYQFLSGKSSDFLKKRAKEFASLGLRIS